jgi:hypothetical protein
MVEAVFSFFKGPIAQGSFLKGPKRDFLSEIPGHFWHFYRKRAEFPPFQGSPFCLTYNFYIEDIFKRYIRGSIVTTIDFNDSPIDNCL